MKRKLLAVYVASTLASIGGISATLTSVNGAPQPSGIWTNGGRGRRKRGTAHRRSPAERIAERARAKRMEGQE